MTAVLAAEWLKLRTVRSSHWLLVTVAGVVLLCGLWSWYVAGYWDGLSAARRATVKSAPAEQPLVLVLPLCAGLLGVLAITSEYATGMVRTSLTVAPRRVVWMAAKTAVVAVSALAAGLLSLGAAFALGRFIVGSRALPAFQTPVADELRWLGVLALAAMVSALVGLGLGAALRSTGAAIAAVCAWLFVLPMLAPLLAAPWDQRIAAVLLPTLAEHGAGKADDPVLSPAVALAVLAAYAVVALGAGTAALVRRDA